MFCYQCEQTVKGTGCTMKGVCGKEASVSDAQDLLIHQAKGIAQYAHRARQKGLADRTIDQFIVEALFTTVTNVNFDIDSVAAWVWRGADVMKKARDLYAQAGEVDKLSGPAAFEPAKDIAGLQTQASVASIKRRIDQYGPDVSGLQELILYGLKGMAAYSDHARILGVEDDNVYAFFEEALDFLARESNDVNALLPMVLKTGEVNLRVMEMLDQANTGTYGHPEPTKVRVTPIKGKAICVSGHDLKDLYELLKQTEGKGLNIYTHGEMLPCHAYPELKKFKHLVGNYGGAWQDQQKEFDAFPGAVLMTTNCIQKPRDGYMNRIFTSGLVQWPGVKHVSNKDFGPVIEAALAAPGFTENAEEKTILTGFARNAVLSVAGAVVDAVKTGKIRHFFLVGGCDGAKPGRNYYTELAEKIPNDCVILTLACGKFRFNKLEFGDIGGIPRLLDVGQCNDAYSAIQIALALAKAFDCGVNDLPLSIILSWYEQKAVCILLTLLHLGVKNMRIGPSLPAFVGPNVLNVLVEKFGLTPVGNAEEDLANVLGA
jgi:hydroxylamine reductase